MEMAGCRGMPRGQKRSGQVTKDRKAVHFQTDHRGGFEETQIICYLWEIVKALEAVETELAADAEVKERAESLFHLKRQMHRRIRVEMRRYFLRRRRRNVRIFAGFLALCLSLTAMFGLLIGIDRVSGDSMYPYLNNGDWIVYSRIHARLLRNEIVVFERNGENLVKRIAGLPGDTVEISATGGRVVVNGSQMRETYVTLPDRTSGDETGDAGQMGPPLTVMNGQYLVLGDNRSVSIDSRDRGMGTVPAAEIRGRVLLVIRWNR